MTDLIHVWTATGTREQATALAAAAVESRLAAGAQVTHADTAFWHEGELGVGEEWQVRLVTTAAGFERLSRFITEVHKWRSPEIVATPILESSPQYAAWVRSSVEVTTPAGGR